MAATDSSRRREENLLFVDDGAFVSDCVGASIGNGQSPIHSPFTLEFDFYAANAHMVGVVENDRAGKLDRVGFVALAIENGERRIESIAVLARRTKFIVSVSIEGALELIQCLREVAVLASTAITKQGVGPLQPAQTQPPVVRPPVEIIYKKQTTRTY
jgi:hypothetical protein